MIKRSGLLCSTRARGLVLTGLLCLGLVLTLSGRVNGAQQNGAQQWDTLNGTVESLDSGLPGFQVSLYGSFPVDGPKWKLLGTGATDDAGQFEITYSLPAGRVTEQQPVLFVEAQRGSAMLVSAIGEGESIPSEVVVNERTTVATANAYAQFVKGSKIEGNRYGMVNGVGMAANLANPLTGEVGAVLNSEPNSTLTTTLPTFNSLSNVVAACVEDAASCSSLFDAATTPRGSKPTNVLQALSNLVKKPWYPGYPDNSQDPIYKLSLVNPIYQPALTDRPTSWLLFLKITGGFYTTQTADNLMNGPGNFAIDKKGFVWVNDNYVPELPELDACAGLRLMEFDPSGHSVIGSPFFGGGLSGAGYGITLDPQGNVWVGDFGFQDPSCLGTPQAAPNDAVSEFHPDGTPISPPTGYTDGNISWPQTTISDRRGNIWMASCGNDSVTEFVDGDHNQAFNIQLGPTPGKDNPQLKPFGAAIDGEGNVWVAGNRGNIVWAFSPQRRLLAKIPATYGGKTILTHPIGMAADIEGNIWVANSDWLDSPCPTRFQLGPAENPSITMFQMHSRKPFHGSPFTGGGLTIPWGIAVDGNDTVWVFNFGSYPPLGTATSTPTGISRFCGVETKNCPPGKQTGDPISPSTGYRSNALARITGGQIDPSGNIWMTSNWKIDAQPLHNPGANSIVIAIGAAGPIKTPLIGPPVPY